MVTLNVQSIKQEAAGAGTREMTVEILKENNTFGFSINQDAQGLFCIVHINKRHIAIIQAFHCQITKIYVTKHN